MEKLALQANELNTIAKIIEHEQYNLTNLKRAMDEFSEACNLQKMVEEFVGFTSNNPKYISANAKLTLRADNSFFALCRELRIKPDLLKTDNSPLNKTVAEYYRFAKDFLSNFEKLSQQEMEKNVNCFELIRDEFFKERENYLVEQETKLNRLIYGNLSIEEIKSMYRFYEKENK